MTAKTERTAPPARIAIDPGIELLENHLLAQAIEGHLKNRNLVNAQQAFERQQALGRFLAESEELKARIDELEKQLPAKPGKKVN